MFLFYWLICYFDFPLDTTLFLQSCDFLMAATAVVRPIANAHRNTEEAGYAVGLHLDDCHSSELAERASSQGGLLALLQFFHIFYQVHRADGDSLRQEVGFVLGWSSGLVHF